MALAVDQPRMQRSAPRIGHVAPPERHLELIAGATKRRLSYFAGVVIVLFVTVSSVIGFQAYIAQQQLKIDALSSEIRLARAYHDQLRQQRAELLAPDALRDQARSLGMAPGLGSRFVEIPEDVVAQVAAAIGKMDPAIADPSTVGGSTSEQVGG
jgi:cell division protein FtsB